MQRSKPRTKREGFRIFLSRIFPLRWQVVSNTPQSLPDSGIPRVENPINKTQDSPSPPSMQTRGSDLNVTELDNGAHDSSPHHSNPNRTIPANSSSLPTPETHSPPHLKTRVGGPNLNGHIRGTRTSSPVPTRPRAKPAISTGTSLLPGARDFVMNVNVQGESNTVIQGMKTLSERVIEGAEYDSSLRDPPPQCHPGTRVQLMEKILAWFHDGGRENALLWLSGPAGVGKSAIIQTIAETLAESNSIGATLFFSKLNNRNDPQHVFITIAYQLATRIPSYRIYITERIALDPNLLKKGMKEQFRIFITEPFGNNGMGDGEGTWAVLLDGLDECEGVGEQSRIITLVSEFVLRFPNAPLIWVIASRPEPHIVATFNNTAVTPSHWSEFVPIDSTQACKDVEHYLDASFKAMRKPFPHLPSTWPSESQFLKLSNGARGLFVFARTAVRFMEDPDYADPVSRLNLILSIIDRLDIKLLADHPFALLDALYTQILTSIPSLVWRTTKRLLGFVICVRRSTYVGEADESGLSYSLNSGCHSLMGASIIFGLELSVAYGSLHKLHSVLDIPDSKVANWNMVTFLHASFSDYLTDRVRSKDFHIHRGETVDELAHGLFELYLDKPWITEGERYTHLPAGSQFLLHLRNDARHNLEYVLTGKLRSKRGRGPLKSQQDRSDCLNALSRINLAEIYSSDVRGRVLTLLIELWNTFREELESTGQFREVPLRNLKVDHLDYETNKPAFTRQNTYPVLSSLNGLKLMERKLQEQQRVNPRTPVMIYGSRPENRIAFFAGTYNGFEGYFCFPYPY